MPVGDTDPYTRGYAMTWRLSTKLLVVPMVGVFAGPSVSSCSQPPSVGGGEGGARGGPVAGQAGGANGSTDDASAGGEGGSGAPATWVVHFDVKPNEQNPEPEASAPTADSNCGLVTSQTKRQPVDVLLVLDRSLSMNFSIAEACYCFQEDVSGGGGSLCSDTSNCTTRWNAIKDAMKTTLATSTYVNWGLKFFMTPDAAQCGVTPDPEVPVGADTASKIQSTIESATKSLSTPTTEAIKAAVAYLKKVDDPNKKFILLATDGEPNCGIPTGQKTPNVSTVDVDNAEKAMGDAQKAGFLSYVVGIGTKVANLTRLAMAGANRDYFPAGSAAELAEALSSISKIVGSCSFHSNPPADGGAADPNNVAVYVNNQQVERSDTEGWKFGATQQDIELTGKYCDDIQAGADTDVQILFGCPGTVFPTILR
jgi:hypothetical protein